MPQSCPSVKEMGRLNQHLLRGWKLEETLGQMLRDGGGAGFSSPSSTTANPPLIDVSAYRQKVRYIFHNSSQQPFKTAILSSLFSPTT